MTASVESTLAALRPLLGRWEGGGRAEFPTIPSHEYVETLHFSTEGGRDHIHFEQRARQRPVGTQVYGPSHWESGFLRVKVPGRVEWTNVQDNGRLEVAQLVVTVTREGLLLAGDTTHFLNDPRMMRARREIRVSGDRLQYRLSMATTRVGVLTGHLSAELRRVGTQQAV